MPSSLVHSPSASSDDTVSTASTISPRTQQQWSWPPFERFSRRYLHTFTSQVEEVLFKYAKNSWSECFQPALPHIIDICITAPVMNILFTARSHEDVFGLLYPLLDDLISEWTIHARAQLMNVLAASISPKYLPVSGSTTPAAFTYLKCDTCGEVRSFLSALFHECSNPKYNGTSDDGLGTPEDMMFYMFGEQKWTAANFFITPGSLVRIQNLFAAIDGRRIQTTTSIELDALDPRLVCIPCAKKVEFQSNLRAGIAMTWRTALYHCLSEHLQIPDVSLRWKCVRKEATEPFENENNQTMLSEIKYGDQRKWDCTICQPHERNFHPSHKRSTRTEIALHVSVVHHIEKPVVGRDFYRVIDSEPYICSGFVIY